MRLHLSPLPFLRRHAWGLAVLFVLITVYFAAIGYIGERLGNDLTHAPLRADAPPRATSGQGALSGDVAFGLPSSIFPASFACARYSASLM